jgi:hypothetical protein
MNANQKADNDIFYCPLVEREMDDSECYDVQMVSRRLIKETVLDFVLDRNKANQVCPNCSNCQLSWTKIPLEAAQNTAKEQI